MENIIDSICEAERQAAEIKQNAAQNAADIVAAAERDCVAMRAKSEAELKTLRERELNKAISDGEKLYKDALEKEKIKAKGYADALLNSAEFYVQDIVRRVSGGNR